jgi:hypothetical protein
MATTPIEYADAKVATMYLTIGADKLAAMSDEDVLTLWNEMLEARDEHRKTIDYVATEVPIGKPQVKYFELGDQWVPRGDVLRCVVTGYSSDEPDGPFISIDDRDFTPREFAAMVSTYGGWGMRIVFVPDDELHEQPKIMVREPDKTGKRRAR